VARTESERKLAAARVEKQQRDAKALEESLLIEQ
jgi:hypothetical protein